MNMQADIITIILICTSITLTEQLTLRELQGYPCGKSSSSWRAANRIINGRRAKANIKWMVKFYSIGSVCGGAFLTPNAIITAAHCFCEDNVHPCKKRGRVKKFPFVDDVIVMAGSMDSRKSVRLKVKRVFMHRDYQDEKEPQDGDLAIVILESPVKFGKKMAPICLPTPQTQDLGRKVTAAGWGHQRTNTTCLTNQFGPKDSRFTHCAKRDSCQLDTPPPTSEACHSFFEKIKLRKNIDIYNIEQDLMCYPPVHNKYGWCYTSNQTRGHEDKWGFCMQTCSKEKHDVTDQLQVVDLETYPKSNCHKGAVNPKSEICVGGRLNRPAVGVYSISEEGKSFIYEERTGGKPYDFIGYKDTCQGDSGGPIWITEKGISTLVAVVSRGGDCAAREMPGVGTKIKAHMDWIMKRLHYAHGLLKLEGKAKTTEGSETRENENNYGEEAGFDYYRYVDGDYEEPTFDRTDQLKELSPIFKMYSK